MTKQLTFTLRVFSRAKVRDSISEQRQGPHTPTIVGAITYLLLCYYLLIVLMDQDHRVHLSQ